MYSYMGTHSDPSEEALTRSTGERTIGTGPGSGGVGLGGYGSTASPVHPAGVRTQPAAAPATNNAEGTPLVTYRVKSGSRGAENGTLSKFIAYVLALGYGQYW